MFTLKIRKDVAVLFALFVSVLIGFTFSNTPKAEADEPTPRYVLFNALIRTQYNLNGDSNPEDRLVVLRMSTETGNCDRYTELIKDGHGDNRDSTKAVGFWEPAEYSMVF